MLFAADVRFYCEYKEKDGTVGYKLDENHLFDFASKMARLAGFLCPTNFNFRAESQAAFAPWKPFWVVLHVALFGEWAGAAVRVYHCLIPPFAVQWRRNFIGKYSSAGLPLVASNSRLFLFLLQNRDEQLLPWLNRTSIRDMVAVHGPVNHDPYIFPVVIDSGADVPKSFILIHHDNLINVFGLSHQRFYTGRDAKGNGRQDDNYQANPPPSVTMLFSRPSHLRHLPFRNLLMKYT